MHESNDFYKVMLSVVDDQVLVSKGRIGHNKDPEVIPDEGQILQNFDEISKEGMVIIEEFPL